MSHDRHLTIYRTLSALYPQSFRDAYREDLAVLFSHQITDEPAVRVWLRTIRDLAVTVPATHLEARMNRPPNRVLVGICSILTAASVATALMIGTGAPGATIVFLTIAVVAGSVSAWAWHAYQPIHDVTSFSSSWWKFLSGGVILIAATFTAMTNPLAGRNRPRRQRLLADRRLHHVWIDAHSLRSPARNRHPDPSSPHRDNRPRRHLILIPMTGRGPGGHQPPLRASLPPACGRTSHPTASVG